MEKYVQDNSFKGISQTTNILETRYIPNTPPVSEEPADDRSYYMQTKSEELLGLNFKFLSDKHNCL